MGTMSQPSELLGGIVQVNSPYLMCDYWLDFAFLDFCFESLSRKVKNWHYFPKVTENNLFSKGNFNKDFF